MTEKTTLEVGDKLYLSQYSSLTGPYTIDRVTATQAVSGKIRFKRAFPGASVLEIGTTAWAGVYYLETPALKLKATQQAFAKKLRVFDYSTLTLDQMERINAILTETPQP